MNKTIKKVIAKICIAATFVSVISQSGLYTKNVQATVISNASKEIEVGGKKYNFNVNVTGIKGSQPNSKVDLKIDQKNFSTTKLFEKLTGSFTTNGEIKEVSYETDTAVNKSAFSGKGRINGDKWEIDNVELGIGNNEVKVKIKCIDGSFDEKSININVDEGTLHNINANNVEKDDSGVEYENNIININFKNDVSDEKCDEIIKSIGGIEVGKDNIFNEYNVQVEKSKLSELEKCIEEIEKKEEVEYATFNLVNDSEENVEIVDKNYTDTGSYYNWGYEAINASYAKNFNLKEVNVGVSEVNQFVYGHDDLSNVSYNNQIGKLGEMDEKKTYHANHVTGIIAADDDNDGVTGVAAKNAVIHEGYYSIQTIKKMITQGCKVVNCSFGLREDLQKDQEYVDNSAKRAAGMMNEIIRSGKTDFIVVQSAGNGQYDSNGNRMGVDAKVNGYFSSIRNNSEVLANEELEGCYSRMLSRIIIVGSAREYSWIGGYHQAYTSNFGENVDVVAPGWDIISTIAPNKYGYMRGTSMAAPQVTALAALIWGINPNYDGKDVKDIICNNGGDDVWGNRQNSKNNSVYKMIDVKKAMNAAYKDTYKVTVSGKAHVQDKGWLGWTNEGSTIGTIGQALRMEAVKLSIINNSGISGGIKYDALIQNQGWIGYAYDGELCGTTGQSKPINKIEIRLTGNLNASYDIYYRTHLRNIGWIGWAKNGQFAGGKYNSDEIIEAVQVVIVPKDQQAPGDTSGYSRW